MSMLKGKLLSEKSFYKIRACLKHAPGVKDLGTILVGKMAVEEGIIDEVGGVSEALFWLHQEIERSRKKRQEKK